MNHTNKKQSKFNYTKVGNCQDYKTLFRVFRDTTNWIGAMMEVISGSEIEDLQPEDLEFIMNVTTQFRIIDSLIQNDLEQARAAASRIIEEIKKKLEGGEDVQSPLAAEIEEWGRKLEDVDSEEAFPDSIMVDYTVDGLATYKIIEKTSFKPEKVIVDQIRL